jgi:hypothetical protein
MKSRVASTILTIAAIVNVASLQSGAGATRIGELSDLYAWVNKMPPGPASIHATGKITAPTPCYHALAQFAGVDKSNPSIHLVKITLWRRLGYCTQRLTDIPFSYERPNYADRSEKMRLFSDQDSKTILIEVAL